MICGTEGDVGDAIVAMCVISQIPGGPHTLVLQKSKLTKMRDDATLAAFLENIKALAESQPYIREVRLAEYGERMGWQSGDFRSQGLHCVSASLLSAHLSHFKHAHGELIHKFSSAQAWLKVAPSNAAKNKVVIARSSRYPNNYFKWAEVVKHYGTRLLFIGSDGEHKDFSDRFGEVQKLPTKTMLDVAQAIAGSELFIGNQSSPMAVCEGLKHPSIQETCLHIPDCIYNRSNAQWCYDGAMTLPDVDGSGVKVVPSSIQEDRTLNPSVVPPGLWQFPGYGAQTHFDALRRMIVMNTKCTPEDAAEQIQNHNCARLPDFFISQEREMALRYVRPALENAQLSA